MSILWLTYSRHKQFESNRMQFLWHTTVDFIERLKNMNKRQGMDHLGKVGTVVVNWLQRARVRIRSSAIFTSTIVYF